MGELLWKCGDGVVLSSTRNGLQLVVSRAGLGDGFRYELLDPADPPIAGISVASGHRQHLIDAISAAERIALGWNRPHSGTR